MVRSCEQVPSQVGAHESHVLIRALVDSEIDSSVFFLTFDITSQNEKAKGANSSLIKWSDLITQLGRI
jgi:hypothetical protein